MNKEELTAEGWLKKGEQQVLCWSISESEERMGQKQFDETQYCYDKAIELDANNDNYKINKVKRLFQQDKNEEAIDLLLETKFDLLEKLAYI